MLYTSYFAKKTDLQRYSIALYQPKGMGLPRKPEFAPSTNIFNAAKKGIITFDEFCKQYYEGLDFNEYIVLRKARGLPPNAVLCCWEKDPAKCHRSILVQWLNEHGIECEELQEHTKDLQKAIDDGMDDAAQGRFVAWEEVFGNDTEELP